MPDENPVGLCIVCHVCQQPTKAATWGINRGEVHKGCMAEWKRMVGADLYATLRSLGIKEEDLEPGCSLRKKMEGALRDALGSPDHDAE